jgi:hypothetical protein
MKTEWSPMRAGGGNFRTHKLVEVEPDRLEFRVTGQGVVFASVFLLVGSAVVALCVSSIYANMLINSSFIFGSLIGLLFAGVGGGLLYSWTAPIVFDRQEQLFRKGRRAPDQFSDRDSLTNAADFKDIHALQLVPSLGRQYSSYELNLVLTGGERLHVVSYSAGNRGLSVFSFGARSRTLLRDDAATLAAFLGKPVWDAL